MSAYSLELTISAREQTAQVFRQLKRFDGLLLMGTALQQLRERQPFIIPLDRADREGVLLRLVELLEELDRLQISYQISANNVPRSSHLWEPIAWTREDVVSALETLRARAIVAEKERKKSEEWLNSHDGKRYTAGIERLNGVRDLVRSRWDASGFDSLLPSEKAYIYIWWLYVEVTNGTFHQYFYNSAGDSALLALSALETLGALGAHKVLSDSLQQFESVGGYKVNRAERWVCLNALPDDAFEDTTRRFKDLSDDIRAFALAEVERDYERHAITPKPSS